MTRRSLLLVSVVILGALLGGAWWLLRPGDEEAPAESDQEETAPAAVSTSGVHPSLAHRDRRPGKRRKVRPDQRRRLMTPAQRRAQLMEIMRRLREATPTAPATPTGTSSEPGFNEDKMPLLTATYIKSAMKEIVPLIKECYENALEKTPGLTGEIVVDFEIVGDPEMGGLVSSSRIDPKRSTIKAAGLRECLRENIYALKLESPETLGKTKVSFPFKFRAKAKAVPHAAGKRPGGPVGP